ncbi:MAG: DUF2378 family protein [Myxococcota bacterium]
MSQRLWFQNAVEGLFVRDLKSVLEKQHRSELKARGIDLERLVPAYPVDVFRGALELVGPLVAPGQSPFEQQRELGHRLTRGYFDTLLGHAMAKVVALVGPERGLTRIDRNFRSITNYLDVKVLEKGAGVANVRFSPTDGLTGLLLGISQASGSLLRRAGQHSDVQLVSEEGDVALMRFEWVA